MRQLNVQRRKRQAQPRDQADRLIVQSAREQKEKDNRAEVKERGEYPPKKGLVDQKRIAPGDKKRRCSRRKRADDANEIDREGAVSKKLWVERTVGRKELDGIRR